MAAGRPHQRSRTRRIVAFICLVSFWFCTLACPAWAEDVRLSNADGSALVLPIPEGWRHSPKAGPVPTVLVTPADGKSFELLVSLLVAPEGRPASPDALRRAVETTAKDLKSQSEENALPLRSFGATEAHGIYFSATDRVPKPGEFKYLTHGALFVGDLPVTFTILSNGSLPAVVEPTLRMLSGARKP